MERDRGRGTPSVDTEISHLPGFYEPFSRHQPSFSGAFFLCSSASLLLQAEAGAT